MTGKRVLKISTHITAAAAASVGVKIPPRIPPRMITGVSRTGSADVIALATGMS